MSRVRCEGGDLFISAGAALLLPHLSFNAFGVFSWSGWSSSFWFLNGHLHCVVSLCSIMDVSEFLLSYSVLYTTLNGCMCVLEFVCHSSVSVCVTHVCGCVCTSWFTYCSLHTYVQHAYKRNCLTRNIRFSIYHEDSPQPWAYLERECVCVCVPHPSCSASRCGIQEHISFGLPNGLPTLIFLSGLAYCQPRLYVTMIYTSIRKLSANSLFWAEVGWSSKTLFLSREFQLWNVFSWLSSEFQPYLMP